VIRRRVLHSFAAAVLVGALHPLAASADATTPGAMSAYLNELRASVGAPASREDARVDAAAQAHATYNSVNGSVGHYETVGLAGYTGYAPRDRLVAKGYVATFVSEVAASYASWKGAMTELWAAPYHRLGMMHPHNVASGWGHSSVNGRENTVGDFVYDFASPAPSVLRSPAAGQGGVPTSWSGNESPNPLPAGAARPVGYPIMLLESNARATVLRSASLVRASDGANVPLYLGTQQFEYDYAFVIPQSPLSTATTYRVRMDLTVAGLATTESWSFTTSASGLLELTPLPAVATLHSKWAGQSVVGPLAAGQATSVTLRLQNTGTATWTRGVSGLQVNLGVRGDSTWWSDKGLAAGWLSANRVATTSESLVPPGGTGTFVFEVKAPQVPGSYRLWLRPVVDGVIWLEDEGIYVPLDVVNGYHSKWAGQAAYPTVSGGTVVTLSVTYRNTGALPWVRGATRQQANLGVVNDDTRWSPYAINWLAANRPATTQEAAVQPGGLGTFVFQMRAPSAPGVYDIRLRPVIDGVTWMEDEGVFLRVTVR